MSGASGHAPAQRAVHVATRRPGKRRAAASDADSAGTNEELQKRLVRTMPTMMTMMIVIISKSNSLPNRGISALNQCPKDSHKSAEIVGVIAVVISDCMKYYHEHFVT